MSASSKCEGWDSDWEGNLERICAHLGLKHESDRKKLREFFDNQNVTHIDDLREFEPLSLQEKKNECSLFENERVCVKLGILCKYLSFCSACEHDSLGEIFGWIMELHDEEWGDDASYWAARAVVAQELVSTTMEKLRQSAEAREEFLSGGVMDALERYPLLAAEKLNVSEWFRTFPYFFFLASGFDDETVRKVHSFCPKISAQGIRGKFLAKLLRRDDRFPGDVLKRVLALDPNQAGMEAMYSDRQCKPRTLLEFLFYKGYSTEILEYVRTLLPDNVVEFQAESERATTLVRRRSIILERLAPQLRELTIKVHNWSTHAFISLLHSIEQTNLESLSIDLNFDFRRVHESVNQALESFIHGKSASLKRLSFHQTRYHDSNVGPCMEAILSAIAFTDEEWYLDELKLSGIQYFSIDEFLVGGSIGSLDIQLIDSTEYACPWTPPKRRDGIRIGTLRLLNTNIDHPSWNIIWQAISSSDNIENALIAHGPVKYEACEIDALSSNSKLKTLCLGAHAWYSSINITAPLLGILNHGCLEFLQVEGSHYNSEDDTYGCHAYTIDAVDICETLKDNKSLQFLFLRGVDFEGTSNVAKCFLDVLQKHNNTTIEFADICDDKHFHTIIPKDSWRRDPHHAFTYENYAHAYQIYYLTCFNRYGRGKVRDKMTTIEELLQLLLNVHSGTGLDDEEEQFYPQILDLVLSAEHNDDKAPDANNHSFLSTIYEKLREAPTSWYNAVKREIETSSLRYDLLRETPDLWCVRAAVSDILGDGRPRKRRK